MEIRYSSDKKDFSAAKLNRLFSAVGWKRRDPAVWNAIIGRADFLAGAFHGAKLVGFARIFSDGRIWAIMNDLCVDEKYRNRGIARNLVGMAKNWTLTNGYLTFRLFADLSKDAKLADFYKKMGFERLHNGYRLKELRF
jgi:GNAT superfamily N-acetyltransferase